MDQSNDLGRSVYAALASTARPTRDALERQGFPPRLLDDTLPHLVAIGMITMAPDNSIEVIPPEIALPVYAAHLERLAVESRAGIEELGESYRRARVATKDPDELDVRVVVNFTEFTQARMRTLRAARESILIIAPRTDVNDQSLLAPDRGVLLHPASSVTRRVVFDSSILELDGALDAMALLEADGAEIRTRSGLALGLVIVDRAVALVDITNHDATGIGSIIIRHPPLVTALTALAEATFLASTAAPTGSAAARDRLGERHAQTLALLAAGASDSTIARQMGISQRTVERHIRQVMDTLGVTTRFQAGVHAARRGLL